MLECDFEPWNNRSGCSLNSETDKVQITCNTALWLDFLISQLQLPWLSLLWRKLQRALGSHGDLTARLKYLSNLVVCYPQIKGSTDLTVALPGDEDANIFKVS